jgi:thiosulfate reductase cytochrome b subunit
LQVHYTKRPQVFFTRKTSGVMGVLGKNPKRISLQLWLHLSMDTLFVLNGIVFYVLIFSTGQWTRIVPTSWDVFPNAVSAVLQYASMQWPTEDGWANYNAIQLLSYFFVVFILAPAALLTGLRMSPVWPKGAFFQRFDVEWARKAHWPIMVIFLAFIAVHVILVLATGALRNLNHMYAGNDGQGWAGAIVFAISVIVMIGAWIALRPFILRTLAATMGRIGR